MRWVWMAVGSLTAVTLVAPVQARPRVTVEMIEARPVARGPSVQGTCNINTAQEGELTLLPGIGPIKAQAIIAHRQKQPFRSIDDLVKVKGIGRKTLSRLRDHLSISGPTTIGQTGKPQARLPPPQPSALHRD